MELLKIQSSITLLFLFWDKSIISRMLTALILKNLCTGIYLYIYDAVQTGVKLFQSYLENVVEGFAVSMIFFFSSNQSDSTFSFILSCFGPFLLLSRVEAVSNAAIVSAGNPRPTRTHRFVPRNESCLKKSRSIYTHPTFPRFFLETFRFFVFLLSHFRFHPRLFSLRSRYTTAIDAIWSSSLTDFRPRRMVIPNKLYFKTEFVRRVKA